MKREFNLIRKIMLYLEEKCACTESCGCCNVLQKQQKGLRDEIFSYYNYREVRHHLEMLFQAGYLQGNIRHGQKNMFQDIEITWKGYEYLCRIGDYEKFSKMEKLAYSNGLNMTDHVIKLMFSEIEKVKIQAIDYLKNL